MYNYVHLITFIKVSENHTIPKKVTGRNAIFDYSAKTTVELSHTVLTQARVMCLLVNTLGISCDQNSFPNKSTL